ncbi:MAG: hypothetical protein EOO04_19325 [Chitinophagaceae bacterium]|nr:MAG: hypothetical protein EOO04_19325 [Chitinophagaceae bacterium]
MKTLTLIFIITSLTLTSCVHQGYFLSPFQANNQPYKALPMVSDSANKAVYASATISIGGANQNLSDIVYSFQGSVHQAHTFENFQFYYGATGAIGNYYINEQYNYYYPGGGSTNMPITSRGNRYFAGLGVSGGADFVIPFATGSEWRIIGLETNFLREFGDYQALRLKLPDSSAQVITRDKHFHTIGITTNVIKKFRKSGNSFGYKCGFYFGTSRTRRLDSYYGANLLPMYISNTLHLTRQRVTGFAQINAGSYAINFQTGINVRL